MKLSALPTCLVAGLVLGIADRAIASEDLEAELTAMAETVNAGVAELEALRSVPGESGQVGRCRGTGIILENGLIATTLSVAGPGDQIRVRFADDHTSSAEVISVDPVRELTLLRPEVPHGRGLRPGAPDSLHSGSWVFVVGFTLGSPEAAFSSGRFSSRTILNLNDSSLDTIQLLQLEANVYPGNSGAAVVDTRGRLVGLILGGMGSDGFLDPVVLSTLDENPSVGNCLFAQAPLGISFAIPSDDVLALAERAESGVAGRAGYLGLRVATNRDESDRAGVWVQDVVSGSPAAVAGVRPGDHILRVNGTSVPDPMTLASLVRELGPGARTSLEVAPRGGGEPLVHEVELGDYTSDYRMRLIWNRLLSRRAANLGEARTALERQLLLIDREIDNVEKLESRSTSERITR